MLQSSCAQIGATDDSTTTGAVMYHQFIRALGAILPTVLTVAGAQGQHAGPDHAQHAAGPQATEMGQAAFAALAEVTRSLMSDPNTDWTRVSLERLRQHLIDMNEVTLNAQVASTNVAGGVHVEVTGSGRTRDAIRRIALAHAGQTDLLPDVRVSATETPSGATVVITAVDTDDTRTVAQVRGLGFIGLMVLGSHHGPHHVAVARGDAMHGH
jgi:hypothetical protein